MEPNLVAIIFGVSFLIGNQVHERYYYWVGRVFDADPECSGRFAPVFPTRTEFRNHGTLTKRQTQAVSIPGHLFYLVLVLLAILPEFPSSYSEVCLVGIVSGGALISWTDDMATRDPDIWKKFNNWMESNSETY